MRSSKDAGFTLVELLVSLALLAIAAVLVGRSFQLDRSALLRLQTRTSAGEQVAAAQDLIRSRIEHLFAQTHYDSSGPSVEMEGATDHLRFLASEPNLARPIQRYQLSLSPAGDLALAQQANSPQSSPVVAPSVLLAGVAGLEIGYYGPSAAGGAAGWTNDWTRHSAPPQLVRIRVNFAQGDRRVWPELIVRPGVTVDAACVLDSDTGLCRGRQ